MMGNYYQSLRDELDQLIKSVPRPNVLVLGMTGAGKSSLVNLAFGETVAVTGTGKPVTKGIDYYDSPRRGLGIFDSRGYELGAKAEDAYFNEIITFATNPASGRIAQGVHLAWYCIPAESERMQSIDAKVIIKLQEAGVPLAVVITKSDMLSLVKLAAFTREVQTAVGLGIPLFKATTKYPSDRSEVSQLCGWSTTALPEALRLAFARAQRVILGSKKEQAIAVVRKTQGDSTPLGLSLFDSHATKDELTRQCLRMATRILYIYEMEELQESLTGVVGLIDRRDRMLSLVANLVERSVEFIGFMLGDASGRELGPFLGQLLSGFTQSITSQRLMEAIGLAMVSTCSELAVARLLRTPNMFRLPRLGNSTRDRSRSPLAHAPSRRWCPRWDSLESRAVPSVSFTTDGASWHYDTINDHSGGIDFTYNYVYVTTEDNPLDVLPYRVYWSHDGTPISGATADPVNNPNGNHDIINPVPFGEEDVHLTLADLGMPPDGADQLMVVLDPDHTIPTEDPSINKPAILDSSPATILSDPKSLVPKVDYLMKAMTAVFEPAGGALSLDQFAKLCRNSGFPAVKFNFLQLRESVPSNISIVKDVKEKMALVPTFPHPRVQALPQLDPPVDKDSSEYGIIVDDRSAVTKTDLLAVIDSDPFYWDNLPSSLSPNFSAVKYILVDPSKPSVGRGVLFSDQPHDPAGTYQGTSRERFLTEIVGVADHLVVRLPGSRTAFDWTSNVEQQPDKTLTGEEISLGTIDPVAVLLPPDDPIEVAGGATFSYALKGQVPQPPERSRSNTVATAITSETLFPKTFLFHHM
jgi:GTP-binding protein EngB required for normal cell division